VWGQREPVRQQPAGHHLRLFVRLSARFLLSRFPDLKTFHSLPKEKEKKKEKKTAASRAISHFLSSWAGWLAVTRQMSPGLRVWWV
jgi:hypothetical protein